MNLREFNQLDDSACLEKLLYCCGSSNWAETLNSARPFDTIDDLHEAAESEWWKLSHNDWKEAFAAHPKYVVPII